MDNIWNGGEEAAVTQLTGNGHNSLRLFSPHKKDNVALRGIDIVVFQKKGLVHAILLEGRELDKQIQWPRKRLFEDKVFLSSYLGDSHQHK
jgi:hypothetical protein